MCLMRVGMQHGKSIGWCCLKPQLTNDWFNLGGLGSDWMNADAIAGLNLSVLLGIYFPQQFCAYQGRVWLSFDCQSIGKEPHSKTVGCDDDGDGDGDGDGDAWYDWFRIVAMWAAIGIEFFGIAGVAWWLLISINFYQGCWLAPPLTIVLDFSSHPRHAHHEKFHLKLLFAFNSDCEEWANRPECREILCFFRFVKIISITRCPSFWFSTNRLTLWNNYRVGISHCVCYCRQSRWRTWNSAWASQVSEQWEDRCAFRCLCCSFACLLFWFYFFFFF